MTVMKEKNAKKGMGEWGWDNYHDHQLLLNGNNASKLPWSQTFCLAATNTTQDEVAMIFYLSLVATKRWKWA